MARPPKYTVDYFPHFANASNGKTIFILESQFGNDGYAFWFKLLEVLATSKGHVYDINNPPQWQFLLAKTRTSEVIARNILNTLVVLGAIDNDLFEQKIIWCQNFVDNLSTLYERRKVTVPQKPSVGDVSANINPTKPIVSDNINHQSKVKETISIDNNNAKTGLIFKTFDDNFQRITESNREVLGDLIDQYNADEVLIALNKAIKHNKRNLAYVEGILKGAGNGKTGGSNKKSGKSIPSPEDYPDADKW